MAWETLVVELPKAYPHMQQVELDKHEGWELVTVVNNLAYFKRQKAEHGIEQTLPDYINSAQFEAMVRRAIGKELGLDQA